MARKRKPARAAARDPDGMFRGVSAFVVSHAVQPRRLEVWKQRLVQMGARIVEKLAKGAPAVNHVLAMDAKALLRELDAAWLHRFRGSVVSFEWLEECFKAGERLPEYKFAINYEEEFKPKKAAITGDSCASQPAKNSKMSSKDPGDHKGTRTEEEQVTGGHPDARSNLTSAHVNEGSCIEMRPNQYACRQSSSGDTKDCIAAEGTYGKKLGGGGMSIYYIANLNRNMTKIFGRLIDIYKTLGDDRRSFIYYKAILVIEKLPFKIESADQVKGFPAMGKSLKDHGTDSGVDTYFGLCTYPGRDLRHRIDLKGGQIGCDG
ncbi:DNA polymerase lambda-like [Phragmites australis]|uniref:DNA polymerase lambda-like n=1 Tax=Phragmites australis TaxID=29695 RepID=UPI002D782BA8|nr:DNA polymerase lambda-like [Phragmites australis]